MRRSPLLLVRPSAVLAIVAIAWGLLSSPLNAQAPKPEPTPAPSPTVTPTPAPKTIEWGAQVRIRGEYTQNLDLDATRDDRDAFTLSRVRVWGTFRRGPLLSATVELQDSRTFGGEASTVSNEKGIDLHQGFLRIGNDKRYLRLGRQELAYGEQRLVGNFDWDNVGRSFDGLQARYDFPKAQLTVDAFAAKVKESQGPPERNDIEFGGLYLTAKCVKNVDIDLYFLSSRNGERNAAGDDRFTGTVGGRVHGTWTQLTYDMEAAWQFGHDFANDRRAWMWAGYLRWQLEPAWKSTVGFEWSRATGDGDPNDNVSREFDNLFPTNHLKYGYLDLLGLRNNRTLSLSFEVTEPKSALSAKLIGRLLGLDNAKGRWTSATGQLLGIDPTGAEGRRLGEELDAVLSAPVLPGLTAHVQAGWFHPGDAAKKLRGKENGYGAAAYLVFRY